jgi:hypothetical protein
VFTALVLAGVDDATAFLEAALGPVEAFRFEALDEGKRPVWLL